MSELKSIQAIAIGEAAKTLSTMVTTIAEDATNNAVKKVIADLEADTKRTSNLFVKLRNNFYVAGLGLLAGTLITALKLELDQGVNKLIDKIDD